MYSGVYSADALQETLRLLSLKRRHGLLEISCTRGHFELTFYNGKIVGAARTEDSASIAVARKLYNAGDLSPELLDEVLNSSFGNNELYGFLVDGGLVERERFLRAKHAIEYDWLYELRFPDSGYYNFAPRGIELDSELMFAVSPGQLLLDMMELRDEESDLWRQFVDAPAHRVSRLRSRPPVSLPWDEQEVWNALARECPLNELAERVLLSSHALRVALASLCDREWVLVEESGNRAPSSSSGTNGSVSQSEEISELDTLILQSESLLESSDTPEQTHAQDEFVLEPEEEESLESVVPQNEDSERVLEPNGAASEEFEYDDDEEGEFDDEPTVLPVQAPSRSLRGRMCWLNQRMLDDYALEVCGVVSSSLLLLTAAVLVPEVIGNWLNSLSLFLFRG